jgi:hypothetical protein
MTSTACLKQPRARVRARVLWTISQFGSGDDLVERRRVEADSDHIGDALGQHVVRFGQSDAGLAAAYDGGAGLSYLLERAEDGR